MKSYPFLLDSRINIVNIVTFAKLYRFRAAPIKIPTAYFTNLEKKIPKLIWNQKVPRKAKAILTTRTSSYTTKQ